MRSPIRYTADPKLYKRAGNKRHSDKVLQFIQVTAALALELAVSDQRLPLEDSSQKIVRDLGRAGLLSPGGREKYYSHDAVKKWRQRHKRSELLENGLSVFRGHPWTDVLDIACTEARLRTALHRLHEVDPNGSKARAGFEDFLDELWEEHEKLQREYFSRGYPMNGIAVAADNGTGMGSSHKL